MRRSMREDGVPKVDCSARHQPEEERLLVYWLDLGFELGHLLRVEWGELSRKLYTFLNLLDTIAANDCRAHGQGKVVKEGFVLGQSARRGGDGS